LRPVFISFHCHIDIDAIAAISSMLRRQLFAATPRRRLLIEAFRHAFFFDTSFSLFFFIDIFSAAFAFIDYFFDAAIPPPADATPLITPFSPAPLAPLPYADAAMPRLCSRREAALCFFAAIRRYCFRWYFLSFSFSALSYIDIYFIAFATFRLFSATPLLMPAPLIQARC
jgi:hypothetical protein